MLPMLMTRAGSSSDAAFSSSGRNDLVRKNGPLTFVSITLSHAASVNSDIGVPQVAPALLTRMCSSFSTAPTSSASRRHSASFDRSAGIAVTSPYDDSSCAAAAHASALREEMYTLRAPPCRRPRVIIRPIPRVPPVTTATLPSRLNKSTVLPLWLSVRLGIVSLMTMTSLFDDLPDAAPEPRDRPRARLAVDPDTLLEGLNPQQRAAVVHHGGPLLIVAGAGSGKTRVLTHRIAWLIAERGASPGEILAITFTNKAAGEMKERVAARVGPRAKAMWVSTFHSACVRIVRAEGKRLGFSSSFSIYDADDSRRLMTTVCRDLDLDPKRYPARGMAAQVSNLKNELIDYETAKAQAGNHMEKAVAEAYTLYQDRLRRANALDFDDLIMTTVTLLQLFPEVAEHYRRRFRHVLVDEYQDTNHAQYVLVKELVGTGDSKSELCVVGDADQSIYAFRGATIRNILQFEADYPDATVVLLEQNYRSTQTILNAANAVIAKNPGRAPKRLWSDAGEGERISGYIADNEHDEAAWVAGEIDRLADEHGVRSCDVALFYRTNAQSRVFEEVFIRVGLPYKVVGGVRFYERREVRDALAYLRVLANPADAVSLRRIVNVPKRGIGERAEACLDAYAERERTTFWEALRHCEDVPGLATRSLNAV